MARWDRACSKSRTSGIEALGAFERDRIGELTDAFDRDGDDVARLQPKRGGPGHADALRSASQNDGAGRQRRAPTQELNEARYVEDHVCGRRILNALAIEDSA